MVNYFIYELWTFDGGFFMANWHNHSWIDIVEKLNSNIDNGLTTEQVENLKANGVRNRIFFIEEKGPISILKQIIIKPWFILAVVAVILMVISGHYISAALIFIITVSSDYVLYNEDFKKISRINELKKIDDIFANVVRDGINIKIPAEDLVIGDVVFFQKGDVIPADLRICECKNLKAKQTSITGEIYEVEKYETKIEDRGISLIEMKNILFKSSIVLEGIGTGIVIDIGENTEVGKIVKLIFQDKAREDNTRKYLKKSMKIIEVIAIAFVFILATLKLVLNFKIINIIEWCSLELAATLPVFLIIIVCLYKELSKKMFKKQGIEIKDFKSIEIAGLINMIYVEKFGFFTETEMTATKLFRDDEIVNLEGKVPEMNKTFERIVHISLLCNNNSQVNVEEQALIKLGRNLSIEKANLDSRFRRVFENPFDIERGIKTTVTKIDKKSRANVVGAVDKILEKCKFIMKDGVELEITEEDIEKIRMADMEMSAESLSVSAFAYRNFNYIPSKAENVESYLVFAGLIGFVNPIKEEALLALKEAKEKNIVNVISLEDSKLTALSLGNKLGLEINPENVLTGVELKYMTEEELNSFITNVKVVSRLTVEDRLRVLKTFSTEDNKMLITGSKLTELPLLEMGDISVAFDKKCSFILKATADVFIEEASYNKLLFYIEESKRTYSEFFKYLKYLVAISIAEGSYILFNSPINGMKINNLLITHWSNFIFIIASFMFLYSLRKVRGQGFKIDIEFNYYNIVRMSLLTGIASAIINIATYYFLPEFNVLAGILILPFFELILVNRNFSKW